MSIINGSKKYQVFISSTYVDLKEERKEVIQALLELDCIPSGMEMFPAADDDQWSLIKDVIDECDYYILIVGGRYGSTDASGLSYTEREYRYALEKGKPILGFLHKNPGDIPSNLTDLEEGARQKLERFRQLVQKKHCKFYQSPPELGSVVSRGLIHTIKRQPAVGWVRGDIMADKDASLEIIRLNKKITDLEERLEHVRTSAPTGSDRFSQGEDPYEVLGTIVSRKTDGRYQDYTWKYEIDVSWNDIFYNLSPLLIVESEEDELRSRFNTYVRNRGYYQVSAEDKWKEEGHHFHSHRINDEFFDTVKIQFRALGLIKSSDRKRSVQDKGVYWTITPYGDEVMVGLRAIERIPSDPEPNYDDIEDALAEL